MCGLVATGIGLLVWLSSQPLFAYPEAYPPFPDGQFVPWRVLDEVPVIDYGSSSEFRDGEVRIEVELAPRTHTSTVRIWVQEQRLFDSSQLDPPASFRFGARVVYTDLTGDTRKEILLYTYPGRRRREAEADEQVHLFVRQPDGTFIHLQFTTYEPGIRDFVDVNHDGRYEMLWAVLCRTNGRAYVVYRLIELIDEALRLHDELAEEFPKMIEMTRRRNDEPARLSETDRAALLHEAEAQWEASYRRTVPEG